MNTDIKNTSSKSGIDPCKSLQATAITIKSIQNVINKLNNSESNLESNENCETISKLILANDTLNSIESAKLDVGIAYSLATLYFMLLKTQGIPTTENDVQHPIYEELNRIKKYVDRINKVAKENGATVNDVTGSNTTINNDNNIKRSIENVKMSTNKKPKK